MPTAPARGHAEWASLEAIHCVTYFTAQAKAAFEAAGLRGFWRGYFAGRAAPLGEAPAAVVTAVFAGFAPAMVERAVPSVWTLATPATVLAARTAGAVAALRAHGGDAPAPATRALPLLRRVVDALDPTGRPLGAANAALPWPDDPVAALWHAATVVREHRGDGHVAALTAAGLSGLRANVLRDAQDGSRDLLQPNRGHTDDEWDAAAQDLREEGLVDAAGRITDRGRALRADVEARTDRLAAAAWRVLDDGELARVRAAVTPLAAQLAGAGAVPYPNPVGAPRPGA